MRKMSAAVLDGAAPTKYRNHNKEYGIQWQPDRAEDRRTCQVPAYVRQRELGRQAQREPRDEERTESVFTRFGS